MGGCYSSFGWHIENIHTCGIMTVQVLINLGIQITYSAEMCDSLQSGRLHMLELLYLHSLNSSGAHKQGVRDKDVSTFNKH